MAASPASCPAASLMSLSPSRSQNATATEAPRAIADSIRSSSARRLARPGQRVGEGERGDVREHLGAPDRGADLAGDRLEEGHGAPAERRARRVGEHVEQPQMRPSTTTGTPTHVSMSRSSSSFRSVAGSDVSRALHDVRDTLVEQRLGHRVDVEGIDLVGREPLPPAAQVADVDQAAQPVVLALPAGDRDDRGAGHPVGLLRDDLEHVLEPVGGGDRARHGDQRAQLRLAGGAALGPREGRDRRRRRGGVEHAEQRVDRPRAELGAGVADQLRARLALAQPRRGTGGRRSSRARRRTRGRCGSPAGSPRPRARPGSRGRPSARARRGRRARGAPAKGSSRRRARPSRGARA